MRRQKDVCNENENAEDNITRDPPLITRQRTMVFFTISQTSNILPPSHSINNTDIITKNFEISKEHNHTMKSIEEIVPGKRTEILS